MKIFSHEPHEQTRKELLFKFSRRDAEAQRTQRKNFTTNYTNEHKWKEFHTEAHRHGGVYE